MHPTILAPGLILAPTDVDRPDEPGPAPDWRAVQTALDRTMDAKAGYETMLSNASDGFRPVVERLLVLHGRHADALARVLAEAGHAPGDGTLMSAVNRTVVAFRAIFGDIGPEVLGAIRDGEAHVTEALRSAAEEPFPEDVRRGLLAMVAEIEQLMADLGRGA